ncbi:MAG: hypothetical protein RJB36_456 [Bacteroidota bacterium]|jgi:hypothetical protein
MMKTILSNLSQKLSQLEAGDLSQAEMENLVEDAKELYERLVVLRYKIYETNVLGPKVEPEPVISAHIDAISAETANPSFDLFELNAEQEEVVLETETSTEVEMEVMDEEAEENIFEMVENPRESEEEEEEPASMIELPLENSIDDTEIQSELESPMPAEVPDFIETHEAPLAEPKVSEPELAPSTQGNVLDQIEDLDSTSINSAWILQIEQSIRADRSVFPLDTLIGSFSLNEKLQFINELFEGSSDAFSTATKKLDALESMKEARAQLSSYATDHKWDLDSEIVEDFIFKICRRYAASAS